VLEGEEGMNDVISGVFLFIVEACWDEEGKYFVDDDLLGNVVQGKCHVVVFFLI